MSYKLLSMPIAQVLNIKNYLHYWLSEMISVFLEGSYVTFMSLIDTAAKWYFCFKYNLLWSIMGLLIKHLNADKEP